MATRILLAFVLTVSTLLAAVAGAPQQGGDQFLDGIGETGLVARYVLQRQRRGLVAEPVPRGAARHRRRVRRRRQFRRVLLLTGDGSHVQLPGRRADRRRHASASPAGSTCPTARRARSSTSGRAPSTQVLCGREPAGSARRRSSAAWSAARRRPRRRREPVAPLRRRPRSGEPCADDLSGRREGRPGDGRRRRRRADRAPDVRAANRFFLGRSQDDGAPTLHARLRDVRIYRIALSDAAGRDDSQQRAGGRAAGARPRRGAAPEISTAAIPQESPLASRGCERSRHHGRNDRRHAAAAAASTFRAMYRDSAAGPTSA